MIGLLGWSGPAATLGQAAFPLIDSKTRHLLTDWAFDFIVNFGGGVALTSSITLSAGTEQI